MRNPSLIVFPTNCSIHSNPYSQGSVIGDICTPGFCGGKGTLQQPWATGSTTTGRCEWLYESLREWSAVSIAVQGQEIELTAKECDMMHHTGACLPRVEKKQMCPDRRCVMAGGQVAGVTEHVTVAAIYLTSLRRVDSHSYRCRDMRVLILVCCFIPRITWHFTLMGMCAKGSP